MSTDRDQAREQAQAAFRQTVQQCRHPGCRRMTTERLCQHHRIPAPEGQWAIAPQVKAENEKR